MLGALTAGVIVGDGVGVAVTSSTKPVSVDPTDPATVVRPPAPRYRTPAASARTATTSTNRPTIGTPRERLTGVWTERRPGAGARGRTGAGAGRPLEGGRGLTWVGRVSRRFAIGRDCRTHRATAISGDIRTRPGPLSGRSPRT